MPIVTWDGHPFDSADLAGYGAMNTKVTVGGVSGLPLLVGMFEAATRDCDASVTAAQAAKDNAEAAETSAVTAQGLAEDARDAALGYAAALTGTSATAIAIGMGSKSFATEAGKQFAVGQFVIAASAADPANWMFGQVVSYSGPTLVVTVAAIGGSGTHADWVLSVSGARGAIGPAGPTTWSGITDPPTTLGGYGITDALARSGGTMTGAINAAKGADIASAGTTTIWSADGNSAHITGTTTITSFGEAPAVGATRRIVFDGALTLAHGTNLILPGAANITTAVDDVAEVLAETTTQHRVVSYTRASGQPLVSTSAMVLLQTVDAAGYPAVDISGFSADYCKHVLIVTDIKAANNDLICFMKIGGTWITSATYRGRYVNEAFNNTSYTVISINGASYGTLLGGVGTTAPTHIEMEFLGDPTGYNRKSLTHQNITSAGSICGHGFITVDVEGSLDGVRLSMMTGTFTSCVCHLYGIKNT